MAIDPVTRPRIAVTLSNPERNPDPRVATYKNERYLQALERHGAAPVPLDDRIAADERDRILRDAHGVLITGGTDLDPQLYGEARRGALPSDPGRDELDAVAFRVATERGVPVLGICRGLQAINVFSGGRLVQHVDGHESPSYPSRAAETRRHRMRPRPGTRLAAVLGAVDAIDVNSFHHQAVAPAGLAPGLRIAGVVAHDGVDLVEALESTDPDRWIVGIQCHPERTESSPDELARLWDAFVAAARERVSPPGASPRRSVPAADEPSRARRG